MRLRLYAVSGFLALAVIAALVAVGQALTLRASPSQAPPTLAGCSMFPADNVWNVPVDTLLVDANSAAYVNTIGATRHVHADFGSGT
jgi:hypothetical protein